MNHVEAVDQLLNRGNGDAHPCRSLAPEPIKRGEGAARTIKSNKKA